jgi:hypothetical protein
VTRRELLAQREVLVRLHSALGGAARETVDAELRQVDEQLARIIPQSIPRGYSRRDGRALAAGRD